MSGLSVNGQDLEAVLRCNKAASKRLLGSGEGRGIEMGLILEGGKNLAYGGKGN